MPRFVIEREFQGASKLGQSDLTEMAQKSCEILRGMGTGIQWEHSYITDNKIYCVYLADNEEFIRQHANKGDFPITSISRVSNVLDPVVGE